MSFIKSNELYLIGFVMFFVIFFVVMIYFRQKYKKEYEEFKKFTDMISETPFKVIYYIVIIITLCMIYTASVGSCNLFNPFC